MPVVVSGCVPQGDRHLPGLEHASVIGVQQIGRVVEVVEETLKGTGGAQEMVVYSNVTCFSVWVLVFRPHGEAVVQESSAKPGPAQSAQEPTGETHRFTPPHASTAPPPRLTPHLCVQVEIVPLSTGCLGACTYCKTRHARGKLGSYAPEAIVSRIAHVVRKEGVRQVWLSSEDTGAYGIDLGTNLPALLRSILAVLPPGVMLRLGTIHNTVAGVLAVNSLACFCRPRFYSQA